MQFWAIFLAILRRFLFYAAVFATQCCVRFFLNLLNVDAVFHFFNLFMCCFRVFTVLGPPAKSGNKTIDLDEEINVL